MSATQPTLVSQQEGVARRDDGILIVLQNNGEQSLAIQRTNSVVEQLLGYDSGELAGRKLEAVLGPSTAMTLAEDVEYSDDAPDLGDVLSRQREIRLRHRLGAEITVVCKVTRLMSEGMHACFQLVIPNEHETLAHRRLHDFIALNLQGRQQLDPVTNLPDRDTAKHFLPLLKNYLSESDVESGFAVLRIDRHAKSLARYGAADCTRLLQHAANCCVSTFRREDLVFALSDHTLALVLTDISRESARLVFNRLRGNIRAHQIDFGGKPDFSVTVTICFDMLNAESSEDLLERCEQAVAEFDIEERNGLIELGH